MKIDRVVKELEEAAGQLGVQIRREKGRFRGGACVVKGDDVFVLNKNHPPEVHMALLAGLMRELPADTIYLKPQVRAALEQAWADAEREVPALEDDE
ncbi:MAG: hypothetical protein AAF752_12880 [Bacteroidota bacterium]